MAVLSKCPVSLTKRFGVLYAYEPVEAVCNGGAFSPDNAHLAVACDGAEPLRIYKRRADGYERLSTPDIQLGGDGREASYTPDGTYLSVAHLGSPYLSLYKREGDTYTKLPGPDITPPFSSYGCAFSPDGGLLAVAHALSPFLSVYRRAGDAFTRLSTLSQLPSANGRGVAFSPEGEYLAYACATYPTFAVYRRSGESFTYLAVNNAPMVQGRGCAISPGGEYLAAGLAQSPFIAFFKRNAAGNAYDILPAPSVLPAGGVNGVRFTPDGKHVLCANNYSPFMCVYRKDGDTFTLQQDKAVLPAGHGFGCDIHDKGDYSFVAEVSDQGFTVFKNLFS